METFFLDGCFVATTRQPFFFPATKMWHFALEMLKMTFRSKKVTKIFGSL